ncbi:uncharacterized protein AB675_6514 [Cyphellophora attinorum]|uniref:Uncharacterized protein n=1 Tax=Cyphellophora attinorum TaxID=1664694 RepID=A0A0N1P3F4_9EURO|nr:uncharacterized protein AB675_6514 [Phialophora attinorum]KPI43940.1 hypothetical protein AB675_6514 [Phialophora attinorum]
MASADPLFINYSPTGKLSRKDRYKVAQHISRYHRNRSKPNLRNKAGLSFVDEADGASWISGAGHEAGRHQRVAAGASTSSSEDFIATGDRANMQRGGPSNRDLPHDGHGAWSDPFASLPIRTRGDVGQTIQFFAKVYAPYRYMIQTNLPPSEQQCHVQEYFRFAMQHGGLFAALLAVSRCHTSVLQGSATVGDDLVLYYYGQGISSLHKLSVGRSKDTDSAIVATIITLMNVDLNIGRESSFHVHMRGLLNVIRDAGGLRALRFATLNQPLSHMLYAYDAYLSRLFEPAPARKEYTIFAEQMPAADKTHDTPQIQAPADRNPLLPALVIGLRARGLVSDETVDLFVRAKAPLQHRATSDATTSTALSSPGQYPGSLNLEVLEQLTVMLNRTSFGSADHVLCLALFYEQIDTSAMGRSNQIVHRAAVEHARKLLRTTVDAINGPDTGLLLICHVMVIRIMTVAGPSFARSHKVLISNVVERVERLLSQTKLGLVAILEDYYLTAEPVESLLEAWDLAKQYQTGHR